ncbi:Xanthine dehydrogenase 1, partial [Orchesella cincta]
NYKLILPVDIPEDLRVTLLLKAPNPYGVLSSKAVGEPPFNLSVIFAIRNAIDSAKRDVGNNVWY